MCSVDQTYRCYLQHTPLTPAYSVIEACRFFSVAPLARPVAFAGILMAVAAQSTVVLALWLVN
jgi:hypothetical protein